MTNTTIDGDHHFWQGNPRPITNGGYQYFATWDAPDPVDGLTYLQLIRRRLSDGNIVRLRFDGTVGTAYTLGRTHDGHNAVGLGISPNDGRLHLSWSEHAQRDRRHRYLQSSSGCMSLTQASFDLTNCRFTRRTTQVDALEDSMTYPVYFNDNRGRLYFSWRYDASEDGDQILNSYNDDGTWTARGTVISGRNPTDDRAQYYTYDPDGGGPSGSVTSRRRGVYIQEWEFDKNDRLHAMWAWRENNVQPSHGVNYIYSDDFGRTWYYDNNRRTGQIGTASSDPITIADRAQIMVVSVPPGYQLANSGLELDSDNNPHIVWPTSEIQTDDNLLSRQLQQHFWRTNDGTWYSQFIEPSGDARTGEGAVVGDIMFDRGNNAYLIYARDEIQWHPFNSNVYVQSQLPTHKFTWQSDGAGGGYMDLQVHSSVTCLDTNGFVNTSVSTAGNNEIRVRMRNDTAATGATIWWTTTANPSYDIGRSQVFTRVLTARDRNYTDYTFRMTDADWTGTLRDIEICPADGVSSGSQRIDWIRITNSAGTAAKAWEFNKPKTLYAAEASSRDNWATWTIEELLPDVPLVYDEGGFYVDWQRYVDSKVLSFNIVQQSTPGTEILSLREYDITGDDTAKDWRFDADLVGWTAQRDVTSFAQSDDSGTKVAGGTLSGSDSQIVSARNLKIATGSTTDEWVHVRMKNTSAATRAHVYFITDADRTWSENRSVSFTITANSGYTTYNIDMSTAVSRDWDSSTIYQLRLDPADDATRTGSFKVDRVYIDDTRT